MEETGVAAAVTVVREDNRGTDVVVAESQRRRALRLRLIGANPLASGSGAGRPEDGGRRRHDGRQWGAFWRRRPRAASRRRPEAAEARQAVVGSIGGTAGGGQEQWKHGRRRPGAACTCWPWGIFVSVSPNSLLMV